MLLTTLLTALRFPSSVTSIFKPGFKSPRAYASCNWTKEQMQVQIYNQYSAQYSNEYGRDVNALTSASESYSSANDSSDTLCSSKSLMIPIDQLKFGVCCLLKKSLSMRVSVYEWYRSVYRTCLYTFGMEYSEHGMSHVRANVSFQTKLRWEWVRS